MAFALALARGGFGVMVGRIIRTPDGVRQAEPVLQTFADRRSALLDEGRALKTEIEKLEEAAARELGDAKLAGKSTAETPSEGKLVKARRDLEGIRAALAQLTPDVDAAEARADAAEASHKAALI